ncbi:MAG TPA: hypothetical protein VGF01_11285, partial [Terracidiphilus sp.]
MHACGVDDTAPPSHRNRLSAPTARMNEVHLRVLDRDPTLFLLRVTLTEHWWITSHEHRSTGGDRLNIPAGAATLGLVLCALRQQ